MTTSSPSPSFNAKTKSTRPPPLELPSAVAHRRTQRRDVASRYLETTSSSSSSLSQSAPYSRCQSPNVTRTNRPATPGNWPQSLGRRQPATPSRRGGGEVSAAERMLLTSGRSLFSSFHEDHNRSKLYPSPPSTPRVKTVEKRKTTSTATTKQAKEKSKLSDQWAGSLQNSSNLIIIPNKTRKNSVDSLALPSKGVLTTRSQMTPKREQITRPASPRVGASIARGLSPSRGVAHPRRTSPSGRMMMSSQSNNTSLTLNLAVDGKQEKSVADDAHSLKLLLNRLMQWRFADARANAAISAQKMITENRLFNAVLSISKLYDSVRVKRIQMQRLELDLKLISILNRQIGNLEEWIVVERGYMGSLVGAVEALKGSTRCLPVDCAAKVNVQSVKDAVCSAVDVMQAMASSICLLLPKVGQLSCLAAELGRVNIKEQEMLHVCRELLNTISALQVRECSLKTQAIQLLY